MSRKSEESIEQLEARRKELETYEQKNNIDLSDDINKIKAKINKKSTQLSPWEQVELARTLERPTTLRSEEHTSELKSRFDLVCSILLEKTYNKAVTEKETVLKAIPTRRSSDLIEQLEARRKELETYEQKNNIDLSDDINKIKAKINKKSTQLSPWEQVELARTLERPTTLEYIENIFDDFIEFFGDRVYGDDKAIVGGIASINNQAVTVVGHQRGMTTKENIKRNFGMPHPEGYRKALRLMEQAEKFNRPIITFIDT